MAETFTYDITTPVGMVRFNIDDRDFTQIDPGLQPDQRSALFSDEELQMLLNTRGLSVNRATAAALRAIANNRSLLVRMRRIGDTTVDYGDIRDHLLKSAVAFEGLADEDVGGMTAPADGYAEIGWTEFATRDIIVNQVLRRGEPI